MSGDYEEERSSSNKTVWIIVGAIASVLIVALLVCGGLGYLFIRAMQQSMQSMGQMMNEAEAAEATGEQFLADIASGNLDDAYALTTERYQKESDLKQFKQFIDKNPLLKSHSSRMLTRNNFGQTPVMFSCSLSAGDKTGSCHLTAAKEGDGWKIDWFTVP